MPCPELSQVMQGRAMWGNFLALAGAWTVSGYLIIGRKLRAKISLIPYIFLVYGLCCHGVDHHRCCRRDIRRLAIQHERMDGSFCWQPSRSSSVIRRTIGCLRYIPATLVAIITLVEPIGSAVLAYFILRESAIRMVFCLEVC